MDWCKGTCTGNPYSLSFIGKQKPSFLQFFSQNNPISDVLYVLSKKNNIFPGEAPPKLRLWRYRAWEVLLLSLREEGSPLAGRHGGLGIAG